MIFIWGFRVRASTIGEGTFFCPQCGGDRHYLHRRARRWFTAFFVPLIPLKQLGEYVQCATCNSRFGEQVLHLPTTADMGSMLLVATREAVVGLLRAGGATTAALDAAQRVLTEQAGRDITAAELAADVQSLDVSAFLDHLGALAGSLNEHGKEGFLAACVEVAIADGAVDPVEQQALDQVAQALVMTQAHARGVVAQTIDRLHQP